MREKLVFVVVVVFVAVLSIYSVSFAMCGSCEVGDDKTSSAVVSKAPADSAASTVAGRVDSIDPVDSERGDMEGSIIIIDDSDKSVSALVTPDTKVFDASSKAIVSGDLAAGNTAKVDYKTTDEGPVAISITLT